MIYLLLLTTSVFTIFTTAKMNFPYNDYKPFYEEATSKPIFTAAKMNFPYNDYNPFYEERISKSKSKTKSWSYGEGVTKWSELYPTCGGRRQSPIRLKQSQAKNVSMSWLEWGNMDILPSGMTLTNNGHTIILEGKWPASQAPFIYQRHTGRLYDLEHVHWHWGHGKRDGSEHKVNGRKGAMEMHMVFNRAFGKSKGGTNSLVVAFIYEYDNKKSRPPFGLTTVAKHLESVEEPGEVVRVRPLFRVGDLVPQEATSVFLYTGSRTVPPCSEPVTWLVAAKTGYVRDYEIDAFRSVTNTRGEEMSGNIRPLQPTNKRDILMYSLK